jgi:hypothetical protein
MRYPVALLAFVLSLPGLPLAALGVEPDPARQGMAAGAEGDPKPINVEMLNRAPAQYLGTYILPRVSTWVDQESVADDGNPIFYLVVYDPSVSKRLGGPGTNVYGATRNERIGRALLGQARGRKFGRATVRVRKFQNEYMTEPQYEVEVIRVDWLDEQGNVVESIQ